MSDLLSIEDNDAMVRRLGRIGAFAPGNYMCKCAGCDKTFEGDKRALNCLPCAVSKLTSTPKPAPDASTEAVALEFEQALRGEANPGDELYGVWEAIGRDARLKLARQKLSAHEINLIVGHARATAPKPAGVEITEEMVERAALALQQVRYERLKKLWDTKGASLVTDEPSGMRDDARAALTAALSGDA